MWEGFDEPYHLGYITFVAQNGRPPGYEEPSLPAAYAEALALLPSVFGQAPSFRDWRRLPAAERASRRARAARSPTGVAPPPRYVSRNYERQQPPLFYYAAAPVAWLLRDGSLPQLVVGMRLFCVLLASLMIPLTARLARLLLPRRGVFFALPFAAFLPNTLFFADRITNDALAWPILAAACVALVLAARRPAARGRFLVLGALVAAGVWTKMSLLPLLPAALCAVLIARRRSDGRRPGALLAAVGLPALLIVPLLVWNAAACGSWTGVTYAGAGSPPGMAAVLAVLARDTVCRLPAGLVPQPSLVGRLGVPPAAGRDLRGSRGGPAPRGTRWRSSPPGGAREGSPGDRAGSRSLCLAVAFVAAMVFHILSARAAGRVAGGEGWYFDLLRPLEACAAAALLCAAIPPRRARLAVAACAGLLLAADAAGTLGLLLPRWAGLSGPDWTPRGIAEMVSGARDAAPLLYPPILAGLLVAAVLGGCARLYAVSPREVGSGAVSGA